MKQTYRILTVIGVIGCVFAAPCASAQSQQKQSTIKGAGLGALLGQVIGKDTESTLIGAAVGAGVGHVAGKQKQKAQTTQTQAAAPPANTQSKQTPAGSTAPKSAASSKPPAAEPVDALFDAFWKVENISPKDRAPVFFSKVVTFLRTGHVQTLTTSPEGTVTLSEEPFSTVGDTLVVNKPDILIQARFKVDGDQLILSGDEFSAILKRVRPE